jgi:hypothetical protein
MRHALLWAAFGCCLGGVIDARIGWIGLALYMLSLVAS